MHVHHHQVFNVTHFKYFFIFHIVIQYGKKKCLPNLTIYTKDFILFLIFKTIFFFSPIILIIYQKR
jgi:hypothetical protein